MIEQGIPFAGRTEVEVMVMEPGYVKLKMPLKPNLNHVGTMYAGALFTLAELGVIGGSGDATALRAS